MIEKSFFIILMHYFSLRYYTETIILLDCSGIQERALHNKQASDEGFSILSLPINTNANETFQIIVNSTGTASPVGVLFDAGCETSAIFLSTCSAKECFSNKYKWLIIEQDIKIHQSKALEVLKTADIFINAEIVYLNLNESAPNPFGIQFQRIYDIQNNAYKLGGRFEINPNGHLLIDFENLTLQIVEENSFKRRRKISDVTLRIGVVLVKPERFASDEARMEYLFANNDTTDVSCRFPVHALLPVADMLGSKLAYKIYDKWTENENSGGAFQSMIDGEADFLFCITILNLQQGLYTTPIIQVLEFQTFFFFRTTSEIDVFQRDFLKPFESNVWIGLIIAIVLISILMKIVLTYQPRVKRDTVRERFSCTFITTFGAFCLQGAHFSPSLSSGRLLFISLFFASILIFNYYTSLLVSTLVQTTSRNKIKTLKDLADSNLDLVFEDPVYMRSFFRTTSDPDQRYLIEKKVKFNDTDYKNGTSISSIVEGFKRVQQQKRFVFHSDRLFGFPIIRKTLNSLELCDLNIIPFRRNELLGFNLPKHSPFKHVIASKIFWTKETGIFSKHYKQWISEKPKCAYSSIFVEVGLDYIAGMLTFLLFFYFIVILLLICENIYFYFKRIQDMKKRNELT